MEGAEFMAESQPKPNEVSQWMRDRLKLEVDSKRLGIANAIDPDTARLVLARAADEIDRLERELHLLRKKHPVTGF